MGDNLLDFIDREIAGNTNLPAKLVRQPNSKSLDSLVELIDKEITKLGSLFEEVEKLDASAAWESIPLPTLSELGWADPSKKKGKPSNAARAEMHDYLGNVRLSGGSLEKRIKELQKWLDTARVRAKDGMTISEMLSFLVFYKTLTYIISDFNKATAGFLFESLLGVVTGGQQIPAKGAGGGNTIADFVYQMGKKGTGREQYVSLKLLTEGGTDIDGSFNDLINDLAGKGKMQYVVVLKKLQGEKEQLTGELAFHEFTFNRETFLSLLMGSAAGQRCIQIANPAAQEMLDQDVDSKLRFADQWMKDYAMDETESNAVYGTGKTTRTDKMTWAQASDEDGLNPEKAPDLDMYGKMYTSLKGIAPEGTENKHTYNWLLRAWNKYNQPRKTETSIRSAMIKTIAAYPTAKPITKATKDLIAKYEKSEHQFMTPDDSVKFLEELGMSNKKIWNDQEFFDFMKRYSYGTLNNESFVITQKYMIDNTDKKAFATLKVGRDIIHETLNSMITDVNQKMFKVFRDMSQLSINLRTFFMKDLEDSAGKAATQAADLVLEDTKDLVEEGTDIKTENGS